jgi:hypothetical protein
MLLWWLVILSAITTKLCFQFLIGLLMIELYIISHLLNDF